MTHATRNPVARHNHRVNRAATHTDRSKAARKGYVKHKSGRAQHRPDAFWAFKTVLAS